MEHDDELADLGGVASIALIAVTVAMHVAAVALLHRSACPLPTRDRQTARDAARVITARLARRGDRSLAGRIERALSHLGTDRFSALLRDAAIAAAERLSSVPRTQLAVCVGRAAAGVLHARGPRACLVGGKLNRADLDALAAHLDDSAELLVGIGDGGVFPREPAPVHKLVEVDIAHLPDPRRASVIRARKVRYRGEAARDTDVPASLVFRVRAGAAEVRVVREGRDSEGALVLSGTTRRLHVVIIGVRVELRPLEHDPVVAAGQRARLAWEEVRVAIRRDPLLAELVDDLYTHAGFGGTAEVLGALVALAPEIHAHPQVAREIVHAAPSIIRDPMEEIIEPLRAALAASRG